MDTQGTAIRTLSDDTVEIELTPADMLGLSQAAEAAGLPPEDLPLIQASSSTFTPPPAEEASIPQGPATFVPEMRCNVVVLFAFAMFVWWSVDHVFGQQPGAAPPAPAAVIANVEAAQPTVPAAPPARSLKLKNPFDATEVFEFPPGTSPAEGRQKIAALLMQRARDRRGQWVGIGVRPTPNLRAENLYRAP